MEWAYLGGCLFFECVCERECLSDRVFFAGVYLFDCWLVGDSGFID